MNSSVDRERRLAFLGLAGAFLATAIVYFPGLRGGFLLDDWQNIVHNQPVALTRWSLAALKNAALSGFSGLLGRPVSMVTFAVDHYLHGFDPFYFKLTNLLIHLATGVAVYVFTRAVLQVYRRRHQPALTDPSIRGLSVAVSAAWLLHPLNLTAVLYVVQRMTSLSGFFVFSGLACYTAGRSRRLDHRRGWPFLLAALGVCLPLAVLTKESGALLVPFLFVVELTLFGFETRGDSARRLLIALHVLALAVPLAAVGVYVALHPEWILGGYQSRPFTLTERLLTEPRVLWFYLSLIVAPRTSAMGLYHDDIPVSAGLLSPATTLASAVGLVLLLFSSLFFFRRRAPLLAFGILFFLVAQALESTVFGLEIAFEHRNYVGIFGPILAAFYYLNHPAAPARMRRYLFAFTAVLVVFLAVQTGRRARHWSNPATHGLYEAQNHPESSRANFEVGRYYWNQVLAGGDAEAKALYPMARRYVERSIVAPGENNITPTFVLLSMDGFRDLPVEQGRVDYLASQLERFPLTASNMAHLRSFVQGVIRGQCHLPAEVVQRILGAAVRNPSRSASIRSMVSWSAAEYLFSIGANAQGLILARRTVEVSPENAQYHLELANVLLQLGHLEEYAEHLRDAKALDRLGTLSDRIVDLEGRLEEERGRAG